MYHSNYARKHYYAGMAAGTAKVLLIVLTAQGVAIPEQTRRNISECTDLDQLETWLWRAATAQSIDDLFDRTSMS